VEAGKAAVHSARDELERRLSDARGARKKSRKRVEESPEEEDDEVPVTEDEVTA
jgi:hypothetical protein